MAKWIVWNEGKSEAVVLDNKQDADFAAGDGVEPYIHSALAERFKELYGDDACTVERLGGSDEGTATQIERLRTALACARSAIKCGEGWSQQLEDAFNEALENEPGSDLTHNRG